MVGSTKALEKTESPQRTALSGYAPTLRSPEMALMSLPQAAGNQAMQRWLRAGVIRAKLTVSQPNDPDEEEADRVAEQMMSLASTGAIHQRCADCEARGTTCSKCAEEERVQRKGRSDFSPPIPSTLHSQIGALRSGGQPLSPSLRAFFEPRFGQDLSQVRVHTDSHAAAAAQAIQAKAFTVGSDVVFGAGQYTPESKEGQKLLAHELTHTVTSTEQRSRVLYRDPTDPADAGMTSPTAPASVSAPQPNTSPAATGPFDPCTVAEAGLTNEAFLQTAQSVNRYLATTPRGDGDYWAYAHLGRRLNSELRRRTGMGHLWLGRASGEVPQTLYTLVAAGVTTVDVRHVAADTVRGAPTVTESPVITRSQFEDFLSQTGVEAFDIEEVFAGLNPNAPQSVSVDVNTEMMAQRLARQQRARQMVFLGATADPFFGAAPLGLTGLGTGALASPFALEARGAFGASILDAGSWRGGLGSASYIAGQDYGFSYANLDRRYETIRRFYGRGQYDFPIYDAYSRFGSTGTRQAVSVKTLDVIGPTSNRARDWGDYPTGMQAMLRPTNAQLVDGAVLDLNALFGVDLDTAQLLNRSFLAVNSDHVTPFRDFVTRDVERNPRNYSALLDAHLTENPVTIGGVECRSVVAMDAARPRGQREFFTATRSLAAIVSERVISNGISTAELRNLLTFRQQYGAVGEEVMRWTPPELVDYARLGGGRGAAHDVSMRSGMRAGAVGTGLSGAGAIYHVYSDWDRHGGGALAGRALVETGLGGASAALTGYAETRLGLGASELILGASQAGRIGSGAASALSGESRAFISGGAAAVVAPAVTALTLLYEEQAMGIHHSESDYVALTARAGVSGGISAAGGALATAAYGAAAGSAGGPVGVLIGIGVGLIVYAVADATLGKAVESSIRDSMERGCPR